MSLSGSYIISLKRVPKANIIIFLNLFGAGDCVSSYIYQGCNNLTYRTKRALYLIKIFILLIRHVNNSSDQYQSDTTDTPPSKHL